MGCTTSHDAFAAAVRTRARRARASASASSAAPRRADPATLCRERAALVRAAADRRFALAAAHAAYFRSLAAVGDALRRFAAAALSPASPSPGSSPVLTLPPSPAKQVAATATVSSLPPSPSSSSTVSPLSHSLSDEDLEDDTVLHDKRRGGGNDKASSSTKQHRHYMRRAPTVPNVVYEHPNAQAQYTQGDVTYGYGYSNPYGPYGEVVAEEITTETAAPRPPPSPPAAETSPWDFFDPFTNCDQFMADYSPGNLPTNSPNYAELRRMEGIPELEDEAELEAHASKPSTSRVDDQNAKGKGQIPENATSNGDPSGRKLQRKGLEPAAGADDVDAGKAVSMKDAVPTNASSKTKDEGVKKSSGTLKATVSGDIDGTSSATGKKKFVAFDEEDSIRPAEGTGGGGESRGKPVQSAVSGESLLPVHHGTRDVADAMDKIKEQFDEAVNCGAEVSMLLEVGKVPRRATPRVLRCGPLFQSSGSSWSNRVDNFLPAQTT